MSTVNEILRNSLGLLAGDKRERTEDTRDVTDELKAMDEDLSAAAKLEEVLAEEAAADPAEAAAQKFGAFELTDEAKDLLQRAVENAARNTGNGIEDPQAKLKIRSMAELLNACDNDLSAALIALTETMPSTELPNAVFSLCFSVQKAAMFLGNLAYRRALDPQDGEGRPAHDHRDDREAPYGLEPDAPEDLVPEVTVKIAIGDVHYYLQLLTEMYGWDPLNPMPLLYMQEKDQTFRPVFDVEQAMDYLEIRRKQSQAKRAEKQAAGFAAAAARAKAALLAAGAKK